LSVASLVAGLPYTFVLFYCSLALVLIVREEAGILDIERKGFSVFIFNSKLWMKTLKNLVAPGIALGNAVAECGKWPGAGTFSKSGVKIFWTINFSVLYYSSLIFEICGGITQNWHAVGGTIFCGFGILCGLVRYDVRRRFNIKHGDLLTDLICGVFVHMFTLAQIEYQIETDDGVSKKVEEEIPESELPKVQDQVLDEI